MTPATYEMALLALRSWQAAKSDNIDEIVAVACTFRNRTQKYNKTYTEVLEEAEINRGFPPINHPVLTHPTTGILAQVEAIYKNQAPDTTSSHLHPNGALWFCEIMEHQGKNTEFEKNILNNPFDHPLLGRWGTQAFFE